MMSFCWVFFVGLSLNVLDQASGLLDPATVETRYGVVEGTSDGVSRDGARFYQFRGIQYALIKERFKSAVEPISWNGTKPAKEFGKACNQIEDHGDENCLFLNVFTTQLGTPTQANGTLLPCVVYLHGGSFQLGSGNSYGPNYLMDVGVVLVTINYRIGILGFLSTGDENAPGNFGLKDQVMALKYVKNNIAAFGGDPSKVTISGQSAGSAAVTYHLISPMSRGNVRRISLFSHAIAQSGTFMDPWALTRKPLRFAKKTADLLNCSDSSSSEAIINCLKSVPASVIAKRDVLVKVTKRFFEDPITGFTAVIEPVIGDGSDTFLSESPYEILVSGNFPKVPLLSGIVKEEGIYIWAAYLLFHESEFALLERQKLQANWTGIAPTAFYFDEKVPSERLEETAKRVEDFYFNSTGFSLDDYNKTFPQLSHLYSDRFFVAGGARFLSLYAKHAPTYPYLYTFNKFVGIEFSWGEELHKKYSLDPTHAAELDMLFSPLHDTVRVDPVHDGPSRNISRLWGSFIKEGVPTSTYGTERNFPPINASQGLQNWYQLDTDTALLENIFSERIAFWESLQLADDDFINCYC